MTNHEKAKAYMKKQNLLGNSLITFTLMANDYVSAGSNNKLYELTDTIVKIPEFVTHISDNAFRYNEVIEVVEFINPDNIRVIGMMAFNKCIRLSKIELPQNIDEIKPYTFTKCNISEINIPNKCQAINTGAFQNCNKLHRIEIDRKNSKLTKINKYAFYMCNDLRSIELPENIKFIDNEAFYHIEHGIIGVASKRIVEIHKGKVGDLILHKYETE